MIPITKFNEVRECTFELEIADAMANIRFPCSFFFEWKTTNGKHHATSNNRVKANKGTINFNEAITMKAILVYDLKTQNYRKKESVISVNLLSNSRPNDPKLVGRVTVDLAACANNTQQSFQKQQLQYCSVQAWLNFRVILKSQVTTNLDSSNIDRSQLIDFEADFESRKKEQTRSEIVPSNYSSTRILTKEPAPAKMIETSLQDRLSKLKSDKQLLLAKDQPKRPQIETEVKVEKLPPLGPIKFTSSEMELPSPEPKLLSNDLSLPVFAKNSSAFDSIRNSQQQNSEKQSSASKKIEPINNHHQEPTHPQPQEKLPFSLNKETTAPAEQITPSPEVDNPLTIIQNQLKQSHHAETQLRTTLAQKQEEILAFQLVEQTFTSQIASLQEQVNALQKKLTQTQHIVQEAQTQKADLIQYQIQISQLKKQSENLSATLTSKDALLKQQQTKINQLEQQLGTTTNEQKTTETHLRELETLKHTLISEEKNHHNTKIELTEQRQWFRELQSKYEDLLSQKQTLAQQLEHYREEQHHQSNEETEINTLRHEMEQLNEALLEKEVEADSFKEERLTLTQQLTDINHSISQLTQQLQQAQQELEQIKQQLEQAKQQLTKQQQLEHTQQQLEQTKQQLALAQSQISSLKTSQRQLLQKMDQLTQQFQLKQLQLLEKDQDFKLQIQKQQNEQHQSQQINEVEVKIREEIIDDYRRRLEDFIHRLKEKEELIAKLHREHDQLTSKQQQAHHKITQLKEKLKSHQTQLLAETNKNLSLEHSLKTLKTQSQKQLQLLTSQLNKLKYQHQLQTQKRKEAEQLYKQFEAKANSQKNELQMKLQAHKKKQNTLRDNLNTVEIEINRIAELLVEKDQKEEEYALTTQTLQNNNETLNNTVQALEKQLAMVNERAQALEAEVELLNAYMPEEYQQAPTNELHKKTNEQNKQLLNQLEGKNKTIHQLQHLLNEVKSYSSQQQLSNSRKQQQKHELQLQLINLTQQLQKQQKQLQKLNQHYKQQLQNQQHLSQQKQQLLTLQISNLKQIIQQQKTTQINSQLQKFNEEQILSAKQIQINNYQQEVQDLQEVNRQLNNKLDIVNEQYSNAVSELGEKQYQLYQTNNQLQQLQQHLNDSQKQIELINAEKEQTDHTEQLEYLTAENQRLQFSINIKERDLAELERQFKLFKINQEGLIHSLTDHDNQLQKLKDKHEDKINSLNSALENAQQQLTHNNIQLQEQEEQIQTLQTQLRQTQEENHYLKENIEDNKQISGISTPIRQFDDSPNNSTQHKIDKIDFNFLVEEVQHILAKRKQQEEVEGVLRVLIENNARNQEMMEKWNKDKGVIQEKAKLASKEIQKVKSSIMKNPSRPIAEKAQITGLLKPTELIVNELINLSETLAQLDIDGEEGDPIQENA